MGKMLTLDDLDLDSSPPPKKERPIFDSSDKKIGLDLNKNKSPSLLTPDDLFDVKKEEPV